jgi:hypothetical protein
VDLIHWLTNQRYIRNISSRQCSEKNFALSACFASLSGRQRSSHEKFGALLERRSSSEHFFEELERPVRLLMAHRHNNLFDEDEEKTILVIRYLDHFR